MPLPRLPSPGIRIFALGVLALLLLIPLAQVRSLIDERQERALEAENSVAAQWGAQQQLAPAYLTVTVTVPGATVGNGGNFVPASATATQILLADSVTVDTQVKPELRHRGMFSVPVYTATSQVTARFARVDIATLRSRAPAGTPVQLRLAVSDARGVRELSALTVNGRELRAEAAERELGGLQGLGATLDAALLDGSDEDLVLSYQLTLAGVREFNVFPLARTTAVHMNGEWDDPSYAGAYLPASHTTIGHVFDARWQVLELNREYPQTWRLQDDSTVSIEGSAFGVNLYQPANVYQQNERSGKYGILVIALLFVAMFLFETIGNAVLHPIQYLLVGLALATFYLLLLALSERMGFTMAYAVAAVAAVALVGGYARALLGSTARALLLAFLHAVAYGVFYVLVTSEDNALLLGACALFGALALVMFLTRHVDWNRLGRVGGTENATI